MIVQPPKSPIICGKPSCYDHTVNKMVGLARDKYSDSEALGLSHLSDQEVHHLIDKKVMEKLSSGEFKLNEPKKDYGNMALPTDTSAKSSYSNHDAITQPRTSQLWSNLIIRNLILTPMNLIGAYKNDDLMTRGDIFVSTVLWPIEDIPKIVKRYRDKAKNIYQEPSEQPNAEGNRKDKIATFVKKYGMTEGAMRTTLPFLAFDAMALFLPQS